MKNCYTLLFSIFVFLFFSCERQDLTPAYLLLTVKDFEDRIDVSQFNAEHDTQYDDLELNIIKQQNFRDVFVSLNGQELGYWNLPSDNSSCKIPLLPNFSADNHLRIMPCVRLPNVVITTVQYPFIETVVLDLPMQREEKITLTNLVLKYRKGVRFPVLETFVQSTIFSSADTIHGAPLILTHDNEGKPVGEILLNDSLKYFDIATKHLEPMNPFGSRFFWEISYKTTGIMATYIHFSTGVYQDLAVFPSSRGEWRKGYVDITEIMRMGAGMSDRVSISLCIKGNKIKGVSDTYFHFGYVKLITMVTPY